MRDQRNQNVHPAPPISSFEGRSFGRIAFPDGRDQNFAVGRLAAGKVPPRRRLPAEVLYEQDVLWSDQGSTPHCTAYAWLHTMLDGEHVRSLHEQQPDADDFRSFYCAEQLLDPWPGDCRVPPFYDGTTVRAGAKVAVDRGWLKGYLWAFRIDDIRYALTEVGPLVIGIDWYQGMSNPDAHGVVTVTGLLEGGHAVVLNGFIKTKDRNHWYRGKNSWGRGYGDNGNFWIRERELAKLVNPSAEFCVPVPTSFVEFDFTKE